jgi:protein SCO1
MMMIKPLLIALVALAFLPAVARAQANPPPPSDLEGVGIDEHLGAELPLDAPFVDENGTPVKLGDYFGDKPVILNLIYFNCPMLCSLVTNGMVDGLRQVTYVPGKDFEIVTVSFNPLETPALAKLKKQNYIKDYGVPEAAAGWHFLTGSQDSIDKLTSAVGFHYKWIPETRQYAHAAAIYLITPAGKLSRYLYGVEFDPQTLRLALVEAGEGKLGKTLDHVLMYCFHYDAASGRYAPAAMKIMRAGGILMLVVLASILLPVWLKSRSRQAKKLAEAGR